MNLRKIDLLITKLMEETISEKESETLINWLKENEANQIYFNQIIEVQYLLNVKRSQHIKQKVFNTQSIKSHSKFTSFWHYAAAAVFVGFLLSGYFFKDLLVNNFIKGKTEIVNTIVPQGSNKATLSLEDGTEIILHKGQKYKYGNAISNGKTLLYSKKHSEEITYNIITIPKAGQFNLTLEDGTKIWLNSESQLRYPTSFKEGEPRIVELIYGEAYFDVSPSNEHLGSEFLVRNNEQEVKVFGTEFNIKAYLSDIAIYTTLVEGKIKISAGDKEEFLAPKRQAIVNKNKEIIEVRKVDILPVVAWMKGEFIFQNKTLEEIMTVLSRWYDVDIEFQNEALKTVTFNGELSKDQELNQILELISNTAIINNYHIKNNKVIIK